MGLAYYGLTLYVNNKKTIIKKSRANSGFHLNSIFYSLTSSLVYSPKFL